MSTKINILYLDDDRENLIGFDATFHKIYNIFTAQTIKQAQQVLSEQDIHVAVIDFKMPEMDGIDFVNYEQKKSPDIVFIIISAYTDNNIVVKAINQHNIYGYIQKPWNYDEVNIMLKNAGNAFIEKRTNKRLTEELKEKNSQLKKALENEQKAQELKNTFLENISHEIRTPLNSILGFNQLITKTTDPGKVSNYVKYSVEAGYDLLKIIDSILEGAKLITDQSEYNMTICNFKDLMNEAIELIEKKYSCHIKFDTAFNEDKNVIIDRVKMIQVLSIIIENLANYEAIKNTITISYQGKDDIIQLQIIDKKRSLSKDELDHLFEPFNQKKETFAPTKGVGMDFFIAKKHIENMNGTIEATSEEKKGTKIQITLPLKR